MDERKRESMISYLRHRMAEFGISQADLAQAIAKDRMQGTKIRYRSASGDSWDGEGMLPQWLKQAIAAGQSLEHFAVGVTPGVTKSAPIREALVADPFAGTRLASGHRGQQSFEESMQ